MITKRNLLSMKREMKEGDFEDLLCKTNKEKILEGAIAELKSNKIITLKTIKTDTPLFKEVMAECGVKLI